MSAISPRAVPPPTDQPIADYQFRAWSADLNVALARFERAKAQREAAEAEYKSASDDLAALREGFADYIDAQREQVGEQP